MLCVRCVLLCVLCVALRCIVLRARIGFRKRKTIVFARVVGVMASENVDRVRWVPLR